MEIALNPADLRAEIIEAAASQIAEGFMANRMPDLNRRVERLLADAVKKHCDDEVGPLIAEGVGSRLIESTNQYGEKRGEPKTFTEYLVETANSYLQEKVDYQGRAKGQDGAWQSDMKQTRLIWMIDKHLQYRIQSAMEQAISQIEKQIAPAIAETIKVQVDELSKKILTKRR